MMRPDEYKPISDYAVIGNLRTVALVCKDGSIDWCCLPHLEDPSVFSALLDAGKGGRFRVSLPGSHRRQQYVKDTNVLRTELTSDAGKLTITDFMPLSGDISGQGLFKAPCEIHRILHSEGERLTVDVEWSPRLDYGRTPTRMNKAGDAWLAEGNGHAMTVRGLGDARLGEDPGGPVLRSRITMRAGEHRALVSGWGRGAMEYRLEDSMGMLDGTVDVWMGWAHREGVVRAEEWTGEWLPMVIRSELVLKLLTHPDTGAIAAAPTTSLPETIGGVRNWDYRYAWVRDSSMTVQALVSMGHKTEAFKLLSWMEAVSSAQREDVWNLKIMYGIGKEKEPGMEEEQLSHLEGYRRSQPVRIGNEAAEQFQLETYGELLNAGYELTRRGERPGKEITNFLMRVADHLLDVWDKPDHGIWEMRTGMRHFTYSKVMAWVALHRAILLSEHFGMTGDTVKWRRVKDAIREQILQRGFSRDLNSFVMSYDSQELDAANLRIPVMELLPADDPRVLGTIESTLERLTENGLVYRYHMDDGLPGQEGAFGLCSFWLSDALSLCGRIDEAWEVFSTVSGHANHVGLFPEQFDPHTGEFLGNFPQAFTHIGLINSLLYLAHAEGRETPEHAPVGTRIHRELPWNM